MSFLFPLRSVLISESGLRANQAPHFPPPTFPLSRVLPSACQRILAKILVSLACLPVPRPSASPPLLPDSSPSLRLQPSVKTHLFFSFRRRSPLPRDGATPSPFFCSGTQDPPQIALAGSLPFFLSMRPQESGPSRRDFFHSSSF